MFEFNDPGESGIGCTRDRVLDIICDEDAIDLTDVVPGRNALVDGFTRLGASEMLVHLTGRAMRSCVSTLTATAMPTWRLA